jgi:hypothetical protein
MTTIQDEIENLDIEEMTAAQIARLEEIRKEDKENSKLLIMDDGDSEIVKFDPFTMDKGERTFEDRTSPVINHKVTLPKYNNMEKTFPLAMKWNRKLWKKMHKTKKLTFVVSRTGDGTNTKYTFEPYNGKVNDEET